MTRPGDKIGPYTLLRPLGRGGFGEVWLAERKSAIVTTQVALKLPLLDTGVLEAVRKEAALWIQASGHPNVVPFLDADIYGDQVVIASEFIAGGSLYAAMKARPGARSLEETAALAEGILAGLDYLHRSGLTHRDLKPDNVLLQEGIPRLTDFGLSRILNVSRHTGSIAGTPGYMAPETFAGDYSPASDLWAVGVMLYELLAGEHPFEKDNLMQTLLAIQQAEVKPLPEAIPQRVREVIYRLLARDAAGRFASADEARQALKRALTSEGVPVEPADSGLHYCPAETTAFIGREQEAAEAESLLQTAGIRLVTLTGFGGIGKTRLANHIAARCADRFPDGVWWIESDDVTSGRDLIARIAEKLRLPVQSGASVREQSRLALREKRLLLVLDNLEQIADAADVLRDLIAHTSHLKCLVTSRRLLELRGEHVLELNPLSLEEAITLFEARAQESRSDFGVTEANREDVAGLCRRLEGVPLAIELAAARIRSLTPRQIQERLAERFRLLQSRSPDLPPRQRALSTAIEWSYLLLAEEERRMLAQISVFAGGFLLEDAEAVCEAFDVLESVEILRRNSFFRVEIDAEQQQTRFLVLESVREYASDRLREEGYAERFHRRHAERFLARAQEHLAQLRASGEAGALKRLEMDAANFYGAEAWARAAGCLPLNAELALAMGRWRSRRGFGRQAVDFVERGLESITPEAERYPLLFAALLRERAGLHLDYAELEAARSRAEQAKAIAGLQNDAPARATAENLLGQIAMKESDFGSARALFEAALATFTAARQHTEIANVRNNLGLLERRDRSGREDAVRLRCAEDHLQQALRLRTALQDERGLAETLNNLGMISYDRGDFAAAKQYYLQALEHDRRLQSVRDIAILLANLGEVALEEAPHGAARLFIASESIMSEIGSALETPISAIAEDAADRAGLTPDARAALRAALKSLPLDRRIDQALREDQGV